MSGKWFVAWDFIKRPKTTFYDVYREEFGPEVRRVQRSVVLCKDDFTTARLVALLEWYGAEVVHFVASDAKLDAERVREARDFVARVHNQRLHARGRKPSKRKKRG